MVLFLVCTAMVKALDSNLSPKGVNYEVKWLVLDWRVRFHQVLGI